jgi:hypothetical protein
VGRAVLIVVPVVLGVYALIDCLLSDARYVRRPGKLAWAFLVVLVPVVGPIAWLLAGRPRARRASRPRPAPVAPDDNPEFLRTIRTIDEEHKALLEQWERDRKRREGSGRSKPATPPGPTPPAAPPPDRPVNGSAGGPTRPPGAHEETTPEATPPDRDVPEEPA